MFRNDDEPNRYHFAGTTEDGKYVVLNTSTGTDGNSLREAAEPKRRRWAPIVMDSRTTPRWWSMSTAKLYMLTDIDAPRYRLVAVDPADPSNMALWSDVLPESEDLLESVNVVGGSFGRFTSTTRPTA